MILRAVSRIGLAVLVWAVLAAPLHAASWFPLGPYGGDARSFAADPHDPNHLYLGTATGWVFESHNGGGTWTRLAQIGKRNDLIIDHILTDPSNPLRLIVGAYVADRPDGGLFISADGGRSWYDQAEMHGQSVRSLARSASNLSELIAGTLRGVYESSDNGTHWHSISPVGSTEIHEIESIAIDPTNPAIIYAGTWHLPWKTMDGGAHWFSIKQGIIDDSDVFSIVIDSTRPSVIFASACSGIYKSVDAGAMFHGGVKESPIHGIPKTADRTRKLAIDPQHPDTVYAGTTAGLYRTIDGGTMWARMTDADVIVNDVYVDPKNDNHILLATDRGGVLISSDGGVSFAQSNTGFSARQISAYASDPNNRATVYVGVVNDKQTGGVFQSIDGGVRWQQQSVGLGGRDVFSLASTADGTLLAGTGHGIFRLSGGAWTDSSAMVATAPVPSAQPRSRTSQRHGPEPPTKFIAPAAEPPTRLDTVVYTMVRGDAALYAGTADGLMRSRDNGISWGPVASLSMPETHFVAVQKSSVLAGGFRRMAFSLDDGKTWDALALPKELTQIGALAVDEQSNLWVGGREGVWYSTDYGLTWKTLVNLYMTEVDGIFFDAVGHRVLVTSENNTFAFAAHLPDFKVSYWDTGWNLRFIRPVGDHLIGATLFDGMVVQPRMVDSGFADTKTTAQK
jgi:photosystem II stability/assembly factor-like uncharacterized protein